MPGRPSLRHQGHRPTGPLVRASRPARGHQARDGGSRGERTGPCKRLAPPLAPEAGSQRPWPSSGSGKSPFNLQELRPRPSTSLPRNDQAMQAVKDQNQRSQHAFELRKRGAKEIRTPDLLHAIQIQTIARCGWMWPCQQLQSLHVARDSPVLPLACSPSCSPPATRHLLASTHGTHLADPTRGRSSRPTATCAQGAQVPPCLAAHELDGDHLRMPGHRHCVTRDTGRRACRSARPGPRGQQARDDGPRTAPITAHAE
jgi:hypothetical protein